MISHFKKIEKLDNFEELDNFLKNNKEGIKNQLTNHLK